MIKDEELSGNLHDTLCYTVAITFCKYLILSLVEFEDSKLVACINALLGFIAPPSRAWFICQNFEWEDLAMSMRANTGTARPQLQSTQRWMTISIENNAMNR